MNENLKNNPELARLVADLTSDGHLQVKGNRHVASFYSKEIYEIEAVRSRFLSLFGLVGNVHVDKRPAKEGGREVVRYQVYFCSKAVCVFLKNIGTPIGNKTDNEFLIPDWIMNGASQTKQSYLKGLYDAEGSIFCGKDGKWQITFKMAKNKSMLSAGTNYFEQIRALLAEFNIKTSPVNNHKLNVRKDGSESLLLRIAIEKGSFKNFQEHIGFDHQEKRKKLIAALKN